MSEQQFDVFLCHNSEDKPAIIDIAQKLQQKNIKPWLDIWELRPGFPWQKALEEQIPQIKSAAVFIGPNGIGPWQDQEIDAFLREFFKRKCPVIPVMLPNCSTPPDLPVFLNGMTWVNFSEATSDPLTKLIWGITGQKPNLLAPHNFIEDQGRQDPNSLTHRSKAMKISEDFLSYLQDTGVKFVNQEGVTSAINDFFVYPDLKVVRESLDEMPLDISGEEILNHGDRILIYGDEQSGKTTLAKRLFFLDAQSLGIYSYIYRGVEARGIAHCFVSIVLDK